MRSLLAQGCTCDLLAPGVERRRVMILFHVRSMPYSAQTAVAHHTFAR